jgi:hypothetical protein
MRRHLVLAKTDAQAHEFQRDMSLVDVEIVRSSDSLRGISRAVIWMLPRWRDGFGIDDREDLLSLLGRITALAASRAVLIIDVSSWTP